MDPASTGTARRPSPTTPRAKSSWAKLPANGSRAFAAWSAVCTFVIPLTWRVAAAATMIANAITHADTMPPTTSTRIATMCSSSSCASSGRSASSSTSSLVCQKNRYGDTVVPNTASSAASSACPPPKSGTTTWCNTADQSTSMETSTNRYASSDTASHRSTRA